MPLRRAASAWPDYRLSDAVLFIPFGHNVRVQPIVYSTDGRLLFIGDASGIVCKRFERDGVSEPFETISDVDEQNHPITVIRVGTPVVQGDEIRAIVNGIPNPLTSSDSLLTNYADVLWYVLNQMLNHTDVTPAKLAAFRTVCDRENLTFNGLVDSEGSTQRFLNELMGGIGAHWSKLAPGFARLHPAPIEMTDRVAATITPDNTDIDTFTAEIDEARRYGRVTVNYDYDPTARTWAGSVSVVARRLLDERQLPTLTLQANGINHSAVALGIARRMLAFYGRPTYKVQCDFCVERDVPPLSIVRNQFVPPTHVAYDALGRLTRSELDPDTRTISAEWEHSIGNRELITIEQQSTFFDHAKLRIVIRQVDNVFTFGAFDSEDNPLVGADVTIDDDTKKTGPDGKVRFVLDPGSYTVTVQATGREPVTQDFDF